MSNVVELAVAGLDLDGREVPPPTEPREVAKQFVRDLYGHTHPEPPAFVSYVDEFREWDGARWPVIPSSAMEEELYEYLGDAWWRKKATDEGGQRVPFAVDSVKLARIKHALMRLRGVQVPEKADSRCWRDGSNDPPAAEIIPGRNGLFHWPTRTLLPATPRFFNTWSVDIDIDPAAVAPTEWLKFLDSVFGEDTESKELLQEWFGYVLSGQTSQQKALYMVGRPRSGKGTCARILTKLVGKENVAATDMGTLAGEFGLTALLGKALAIADDTRLRNSEERVTERLLSLTSGELLQVNRKNQRSLPGVQFPTRLMFMSNETPRLSDASKALVSRFLWLSFPKSFLGREDNDLQSRLEGELPGILNWALDGLDRLNKRGHFVQPKAGVGLKIEAEDLGSGIGAFLRECCMLDMPDAETPCGRLYEKYRAWCSTVGLKPMAAPSLSRDLRASAGITSTPNAVHRGGVEKKQRYYVGVRLADELDDYLTSRAVERLLAEGEAQ